jgi:predicted nucleic acid-binding protein
MVYLETQAKLAVQQMIKEDRLELIWSDVLDYENNRNPFMERSSKISEWAELAALSVPTDDDVVELGNKLCAYGLKKMDALHIASAITAETDYFITVDKGILK